jgi:hypothetical protein
LLNRARISNILSAAHQRNARTLLDTEGTEIPTFREADRALRLLNLVCGKDPPT